MNKNIEKLYQLAAKSSRTIIGLMSGTSLDGLDIALCQISGSGTNTHIELAAFETIPYGDSFKEEIRSVFAKRMVDLEKVCLLNGWVAKQHGKMILQCLEKWGIAAGSVDLVASHGQTIYHSPKSLRPKDQFGNATMQIGDGDHLAVTTGIITISDFRQKHIATGGEGAPLAAYGDRFLFSKEGEERIMLNIGGIANFTYLPAHQGGSKVFSTDTGPGNTLIDACSRKYFNRAYDKDAELGRSGVVNDHLLMALLNEPFFEKEFPKTTGPELFNIEYVDAAIEKAGIVHIAPENLVATLTRFSAVTIAAALQKRLTGNGVVSVYTSGGGMHNPLLMEHLYELLPSFSFYTTAQLGINPDAKEAVLFAILANECVAGSAPGVTMGKISFPS